MKAHFRKGVRAVRIVSKGVALIEALIALAVIVAGSAAIFGVQSYVMGTSAENRLRSIAMSLAQDKLEEMRTFDAVSVATLGAEVLANASGVESALTVPGIGRPIEAELTWCRRIVPVVANGTFAAPVNLREAQVTVVRGGDVNLCNPFPTAGLAALTTFLSEQDVRAAAQNYSRARMRDPDGDGEVVEYDLEGAKGDPDLDVELRPTGFQEVRGAGDSLLAVYDATSGKALVPRSGSEDGEGLKFTEINGNVLFEGLNPEGLDLFGASPNFTVQAEGNALCRVFYPGSSSDPRSSPPAVSSSGLTTTYIQYSCVVADGWERAILVRAPIRSGLSARDQVCVGYPELESETIGLAFPGRQYFGGEGMRGAADGSSVIGSVCPTGLGSGSTPFCETGAAQGWVPGGHHFFVMNGPATSSRTCGNAMVDTLTSLNSVDGILDRNPEKVYCTNAKSFFYEEGPGTDPVSECVSFTRVSGFVERDGSLNPACELVGGGEMPASGFLVGATMSFGPDATDAMGYLCDFRGESGRAQITIRSVSKVVPEQADASLGDIPHDAILMDFPRP